MKYRTVPSSLKTWEEERAVGNDAAHNGPSPSTSCLWDKIPSLGQAQSQHSLGAEIMPAAGKCLNPSCSRCWTTAGLRKGTLLSVDGHSWPRRAMLTQITQLPVSIPLFGRRPPAAQPQRGYSASCSCPQERGIPGWRGKVPAGPGPQGKMLCRVAGKAREVSIRHNIIIIILKKINNNLKVPV